MRNVALCEGQTHVPVNSLVTFKQTLNARLSLNLEVAVSDGKVDEKFKAIE